MNEGRPGGRSEPVRERRLHSILTAEKVTGIDARRLRKLLAEGGWVASAGEGKPNAWELVDAEALEPFLASLRQKVSALDLRISERPDSDFTKSRTAVSVSPGQFGDGWSLVCCHASSVKISGFSVGVNPGFLFFRRMLSPFSSMRWALWMMRSRMASAIVGSPII